MIDEGKSREELLNEIAELRRQAEEALRESRKMLRLVEKSYRADTTEQMWAETSKFPLHDEAGNVVGVLGTYEDITDRKRAEEALRESQRLLERTFAGLRDAVFIVDADTTEIVDCNPAASRLFAYSREEMLGRTTSFLHVDDASLEEFRGHLYPAVEEKGFLFLPEFRMRRKDGTIFFTEHTALPLEEAQGKRVAWVSVVRDITERKQADEELHAYQERLRSLASELPRAEERERRRIAAGLHDNITQDLIAAKTSLANCPRRETAAACAECTAQVQGLVGKSISELRALTFELSSPILYELGLVAAFEEMVDEFQEKHGIQAEFEDGGKAKPLGPDRGALVFRAVRELLVNVVKHAQADRLTVSTVTDNEGLKVVVEDDGVGFDTAGAASTMAESGGFGLFGIRERLEYVGGELRLESEPGRGARATLVVPLQEEHRKTDTERIR